MSSKARGGIALICSPYAGDTERNVAYAKSLSRHALELGYAPVAYHLILPTFLEDSQENRALALGCVDKTLLVCDIVLVGIDYGISEGMANEIRLAEELHVEIEPVRLYEGDVDGPLPSPA